MVLIATAPRPGTPTARMQRLLEAGHPHRVCAVLLGDWPTPTRVTVGEDGTAAQITGPFPADLSGARLFTVQRIEITTVDVNRHRRGDAGYGFLDPLGEEGFE